MRTVDLAQPVVSVIMPMYNVESFIAESIGSIQTQTFHDLELIVIDDGSTDASAEIARNFCNHDNRLKLIQQENQGPGAARNLGLRHATGKYVYFFDSDDVLDPKALEVTTEHAERLQLDLVAFSGASFTADDLSLERFQRYDRPRITAPLNGGTLLSILVQEGRFSASPCLYMFSRNLVIASGLAFDTGCIHEDEGFTPLLFMLSDRAVSLDDRFFRRRVREGSIMTSTRSYENIEGLVRASTKIIQAIRSDSRFLTKNGASTLLHHVRKLLRNARRDSERLSWQPQFRKLLHETIGLLSVFQIDPWTWLYAVQPMGYFLLRRAARLLRGSPSAG